MRTYQHNTTDSINIQDTSLNMHTNPTEFEQTIIDEVNLARTKPREYAAHIHNVMQRNPDAVSSYEELFNVLRVRSSVSMVGVSNGLCAAAKKRADAVSTRVRAYDHADLISRASKYGKVEDPGSLKEVVWAGRTGSDIRKLVLTILADETNPNRSRRTALLSASSTVCGVAVTGSVITVILAKGFSEPSPHTGNTHSHYGVSNYSTRRVFSSHHPDEPSQQKPMRQVLGTHGSYKMPASPTTPRLNEYSDIKKILPSSRVELTKTIPPPVGQPPAPARVSAPVDSRGQIVGLSNLKTTLASGSGESNYVGYNSKLKNRIVGWLKDIELPVDTRM